MVNIIYYGGKFNERVEITDEMKKEAEEFSKAVETGKIDEWFNKK